MADNKESNTEKDSYLDALRQALKEGEESGLAEDRSLQGVLAELKGERLASVERGYQQVHDGLGISEEDHEKWLEELEKEICDDDPSPEQP